MHPYHHALSSEKKFGGQSSDYLPLHDWFDATKSTLAFATHRALRHHTHGIKCAESIFGKNILNSDETLVSVQSLSEQHFDEDCRKTPLVEDWLNCMELPPWVPQEVLQWPDIVQSEAKRLWVDEDLISPVCEWFAETSQWFSDNRHLSMRHHAFGIFEAEQKFGSVLISRQGTLVPIRYLGEKIVRLTLGRIPPASDWLRKIKAEPWMIKARNPSDVLSF